MKECKTLNALGKELKRLRKEKNLSQEEVAKQLHVKRQTYSHYETGRIQPSAKSLYVLADLYGVSMSVLLRYMDVGLEAEKDSVLLMQEEELLRYYRKLDEKGRVDILALVKWEGVKTAACRICYVKGQSCPYPDDFGTG